MSAVGRADHDYSGRRDRFSKRVNSRMNASLTTPVGPLRCLAMISSAMPCVLGGLHVRVLLLAEDHEARRRRPARGRPTRAGRRAAAGDRIATSGARLSCDSTTTGTFSSLASPFKRARDRRQLERAVLEAAAALHQLDVVDDDQVAGRARPPAGAHLARISSTPIAGVSSMKILRLAQRADRLRQPAPVALAEEPAAQPVRVDPRLRRSACGGTAAPSTFRG